MLIIRFFANPQNGGGDDFGGSCTVDATGNVFLVGKTSSNTGTAIATMGAHQSFYGGGPYDGFW